MVCSPQRRLLSCEVDVRLFDRRFLHSCAAADEGDVCLVHCSPGYSMASEPTLLSCQAGQLTGGALPGCSPAPCSFGFPSGLGVQSNCENRKTGENCTAWCEEAVIDNSVCACVLHMLSNSFICFIIYVKFYDLCKVQYLAREMMSMYILWYHASCPGAGL